MSRRRLLLRLSPVTPFCALGPELGEDEARRIANTSELSKCPDWEPPDVLLNESNVRRVVEIFENSSRTLHQMLPREIFWEQRESNLRNN